MKFVVDACIVVQTCIEYLCNINSRSETIMHLCMPLPYTIQPAQEDRINHYSPERRRHSSTTSCNIRTNCVNARTLSALCRRTDKETRTDISVFRCKCVCTAANSRQTKSARSARHKQKGVAFAMFHIVAMQMHHRATNTNTKNTPDALTANSSAIMQNEFLCTRTVRRPQSPIQRITHCHWHRN